MVPTLTCGLDLSNFSLDMQEKPLCVRGMARTTKVNNQKNFGAHIRSRTGDLVLTKDALYHLSYMGEISLHLAQLNR